MKMATYCEVSSIISLTTGKVAEMIFEKIFLKNKKLIFLQFIEKPFKAKYKIIL
jgi:hypothetical protein